MKQIWILQGRVLDGDWHDLKCDRKRKNVKARFRQDIADQMKDAEFRIIRQCK